MQQQQLSRTHSSTSILSMPSQRWAQGALDSGFEPVAQWLITIRIQWRESDVKDVLAVRSLSPLGPTPVRGGKGSGEQ